MPILNLFNFQFKQSFPKIHLNHYFKSFYKKNLAQSNLMTTVIVLNQFCESGMGIEMVPCMSFLTIALQMNILAQYLARNNVNSKNSLGTKYGNSV